MSARIAGMGWVTPLGTGLGEVYEAISRGDQALLHELSSPLTGASHPFFPVPKQLADAAGRNPRLRRSSSISCFAASAGLAAMADAGVVMDAALAKRTAVVFGIVSGGVYYTRRFYETLVSEGARAASPILFPETVYNAPASHLSALLGLDGSSYTLVGDASVGIGALQLASQLLDTGEADQCLVVGAEEVDWVLCDSYLSSGLSKRTAGSRRGMILAEGAAALLLRREGPLELERIEYGIPFFSRREARAAIRELLGRVASPETGLVVGSANGTFIDAMESEAIGSLGIPAIYPKKSLGEALGASALIQTVFAGVAVRERVVREASVSVLGLNHLASGAKISRADR